MSGKGSEPGNDQTTRRTFLRGVGVTMALPWLESVPVWGASASAALGDVSGEFPKHVLPALFME